MKQPYYVDPENSDRLFGPNGFECQLGEPEDRTWGRDAKMVVAELNRLAAELVSAEISLAFLGMAPD